MKEKSLTYEQVLELVKKTNESIFELKESQAKTDAQLAKTDAQLAKTDAQLAKTDAQLAKTDAQLAKTDKQLKETFAQIKESQAKTDAQLAETDVRLKETSIQIKESQAKTDKQIKELGIQIGGLNRSFGKFTEDLLFNSLSKLMKEKFSVQFFITNNSREMGASSIEIDAMGIVNGKINSVYLTEVKSSYNKKTINQLNATINKFDTFFPELSDKKKFGIIAVPHLKEEQAKEIIKAGFYPATMKNDMLVIDTPKNFKAKAF